MRENDGSAFAFVDIGHSPALDFQELLSSERLCALGHCLSPLEHSESVLMSRICNSTPVGPDNTAPFRVRLTARRRVGMTMQPNRAATKQQGEAAPATLAPTTTTE